MFERPHQPLIPPRAFAWRLARSALVGLALVLVSLGIGVTGYHRLGRLGLVDSILNASMILTGMGPVDPMKTPGAKLFASAYALFSGIVFLGTVGVIMAPIAHRFLHRFHMPVEDDESGGDKAKPKPKRPARGV